jgi:hypothetical protein
MRHPFDGVNESSEDNLNRRSALGTMAAAAAGLLGLNAAANAQQLTSQAIGEEGGPVATTLAIGEEGGPRATTLALGEEGAGVPAQVSTEPFGEEAGKVVSRMTPGLEDGGMAKPPVTEAGKEQGGPSTEAVGEEGAKSTAAVGEEGGATSAAIGEEGGPITRALREGGMTKALMEEGVQAVVPVKPASVELKKEQLQAVWTDMSSKDAVKGVQACALLYGAKDGLSFLKDNLTTDKIKLRQADEKTVARLVADLDSEDFETREKAEQGLSQMGPTAAIALEKALKASKSVEQTMRLARLLETVKNPPALTQGRRGLEVLVALRTPEAKELLEKLAKGEEAEWLTKAAKEALERANK